MRRLEIYLLFNGNSEEAINYYASVFGGRVLLLNRFSELPPAAGLQVTAEQKDRVMHSTLQFKPGVILMASDTISEDATIGDNFQVTVVPESREELDRLCAELSDGGSITNPPAETFWGAYHATCCDRFGVNWMFNFGMEGAAV